MQRAAAVRRANPALHRKVRDGEISLSDADRAITEASTENSGTNGEESEYVPGPCGHERRSRPTTDEQRCIIQFKALVKALSEQLNKTKAEIKAYIKKYLA